MNLEETNALAYFVLLSTMKKKGLMPLCTPLGVSSCPYSQKLDVRATNTLAYFVSPSAMRKKKFFFITETKLKWQPPIFYCKNNILKKKLFCLSFFRLAHSDRSTHTQKEQTCSSNSFQEDHFTWIAKVFFN